MKDTSIHSLIVRRVNFTPTKQNKDRWLCDTDKGDYSVWDDKVAEELHQQWIGKSILAKVSTSPDGKYKNIMAVAKGDDTQSAGTEKQLTSSISSPAPETYIDKSNDIRSQCAMKCAVELMNHDKLGVTWQTLEASALDIYTMMGKIAKSIT